MQDLRTALVTGAAGYIGAHTCQALAKASFSPVVYDNLVCGHEEAVRWGAFERGDILDRARLDEVIARHRPSAVMHFAAFAYVGESVTDPGKYYRNNFAGALVLLEAMRDHLSTAWSFRAVARLKACPNAMPITEETPQPPINPYGKSKLMVEQMLADFDTAYGLRFIALRYFNAAGADADGEIGECHSPETHLIPLALEAAAGRGPPLTVFGQDRIYVSLAPPVEPATRRAS